MVTTQWRESGPLRRLIDLILVARNPDHMLDSTTGDRQHLKLPDAFAGPPVSASEGIYANGRRDVPRTLICVMGREE
jgi:hypothetical protein